MCMDTIRLFRKHSPTTELIVVLILLIAGAFYWYELRPTMIVKECGVSIREASENGIPVSADTADDFFKACMRMKGINI